MIKNSVIWFKRKFKFDIEAEQYPIIVERLRGAPVRLEEKLDGVDEAIMKINPDGWSIKKQIGHLILVEGLWMKRVENFKRHEKDLFAADLKNTRTEEVDYDAMPITDLLAEFRRVRAEYVAALESFEESDVERVAHHPRLDMPMRLIDSAYFSAEHDDHHLSRIHDLVVDNS